MDKIIMKNMMFYGFHGAMEEENTLGQRFHIDAILYADLKKAGQTDELTNTLHYGLIFEKIKFVVEKEQYRLIEALAHNICITLLKEYSELDKIQLTVKKPGAPVCGIFDYMAVEITRSREDL